MQIKRPDPHPPEHEHNDPSNPAPPPTEPSAEAEMLVSEPSTCPYCQQADFGVTYDAPPFRRGLSYQNPHHGLTSLSSAMSSSSSLNSTSIPPAAVPTTHKRRTTSISANASTVITTDRIRPDWATKLSTARSHLARRSAAATALHTAAYLMGNNTDSRGFRSRFGRHRHESSPGTSGAVTPSPAAPNDSGNQSNAPEQDSQTRREGGGGSSRRRTRMEDLEEMMMMEAIRLSLVAEEERKKKTEKEAAKEAKKKLKEEKKREKKERKVYGSGASSASGSALSLSLPSLGRRRGNSGASNLQREITHETPEPSDPKGKGVDRTLPVEISRGESSSSSGTPGARNLDISSFASANDSHQASPSPTAPEKPSHLRQMSNASSPASSFVESAGGSLRHNSRGPNGSSSTLDSPHASGTNIATHSDETPPENEEGHDGTASEPMFNFRSLAEMIGSEDRNGEDKQDAAKHIEYLNGGQGEGSDGKSHAEKEGTELEESVATLRVNSSASGDASGENRQTTLLEPQRTTPEVMLTPETPAAANDDGEDKQLGSGWSEQVTREITQ